MNTTPPYAPERRVVLYRVAFLLCLIVILGCRSKKQETAIGSWHKTEGKERIEFHSDGTLRGVDEYGRPLSGSFTRIDGERVRIELIVRTTNAAGDVASDNASGVCKLIVKADSLTLVEPDGARKEYRKTQ